MFIKYVNNSNVCIRIIEMKDTIWINRQKFLTFSKQNHAAYIFYQGNIPNCSQLDVGFDSNILLSAISC